MANVDISARFAETWKPKVTVKMSPTVQNDVRVHLRQLDELETMKCAAFLRGRVPKRCMPGCALVQC